MCLRRAPDLRTSIGFIMVGFGFPLRDSREVTGIGSLHIPTGGLRKFGEEQNVIVSLSMLYGLSEEGMMVVRGHKKLYNDTSSRLVVV